MSRFLKRIERISGITKEIGLNFKQEQSHIVMDEKKFYEKYGAWKNHASHGNCVKLIRSMDLYVEGLMYGSSKT